MVFGWAGGWGDYWGGHGFDLRVPSIGMDGFMARGRMGCFWYKSRCPRGQGCTIARQAWRCLGVGTQIDLCSFWGDVVAVPFSPYWNARCQENSVQNVKTPSRFWDISEPRGRSGDTSTCKGHTQSG